MELRAHRRTGLADLAHEVTAHAVSGGRNIIADGVDRDANVLERALYRARNPHVCSMVLMAMVQVRIMWMAVREARMLMTMAVRSA